MSKIFRIDYYPNQAYFDFSRLEADHVGVLMQIINLIYMNQGPIENDEKWISKSLSNLGPSKCRRIVDNLIEQGHLYITDRGQISKKMNEIQLKLTQDRRENLSISGRTAANQRWGNEQNQKVKNAERINSKMPSTSTRDSNSSTPLTPQGGDGDFPSSKPIAKGNQNAKRKSKTEQLAEQAADLLAEYGDPKADHGNDSLL